MESIQTLRKQRKDQLVERLVALTKDLKEKDERLIGAGIIGLIAGFLIGKGW